MKKFLFILLITFSCSEDPDPDPIITPITSIFNSIGTDYLGTVTIPKIIDDSLGGYYEGRSYRILFDDNNYPPEADSSPAIERELQYDIEFIKGHSELLKDIIGYRHYPDTSILFNWYIIDYGERTGLLGVFTRQTLYIKGEDPIEYTFTISEQLAFSNDKKLEFTYFGNNSNNPSDQIIHYYDSIIQEFKAYEILEITETFVKR